MMHTFDISRTDISGQRQTSLLGRLLAAYQAMKKRSEARQAVERLLHQDDRILDDIGLTRADVMEALAKGAKVDPTEHLARCRRARQAARRQGRAL